MSVCARERCENVVPPKAPGSPGRPRVYCSHNCAKRACDERHRARCVDCGEPLAARSGWKQRGHTYERCWGCETSLRLIARETRLEDIALMWDSGMAVADIVRELGWGPNSIPPELSELMLRGRIQARRAGVRLKHEQRSAA